MKGQRLSIYEQYIPRIIDCMGHYLSYIDKKQDKLLLLWSSTREEGSEQVIPRSDMFGRIIQQSYSIILSAGSTREIPDLAAVHLSV